MTRKIITISLCVLGVISGIYLLWPSPLFPEALPGSYQSFEPADSESFNRRAYYTNLSRMEVMDILEKRFRGPIQYRLNYPPEEAYALVREQTRSSFLEEIVHPLRESLFINGFVPTKPTDEINFEGKHYLNKITLRVVPSHPIARLTTLLMTMLVIRWMSYEYLGQTRTV